MKYFVYLCPSGDYSTTYGYIAPNTAFASSITAYKKHICLTFIFLGVVPGEKTGRKEEYLAICLVISLFRCWISNYYCW